MARDGARYFGPYGTRGASQGIIDALQSALRLPSCKRKFPRDIGKEGPCLNFHMGTCDGYCRPDMDQNQYRQGIDQAVRLLEGKLDEVVAQWTREMEQAAEDLRFEKAAQYRDRIRAVQLLAKRQKAVVGSLADTDVVGYHRGEAKSCFVVLHYVDGELAAKDWQLLPLPMEEDEGESVATLTAQYYQGRQALPRQILLPLDFDGQVELARMLTQAVGRKVELLTPQRGAKTELVALANQNAREEVQRATTAQERTSKLMEALGRLMGLDQPPHRMEAFDISNSGNADIVASMTVHVDGRPLKRDYRHFTLKGLEHADDYASMEQVIARRFRRYLDGDEKFGALPVVLLIDGGVGQVRAATSALETLGLSIPTFGMVKDDRHRTRALVDGDGQEMGLQQSQALFALIGRIQEETHRFAIEFMPSPQGKRMKGSVLDDIPGVGPTRKTALLKHFKSIKAIRGATVEELSQVVPKNTAQAVHDYLNKE